MAGFLLTVDSNFRMRENVVVVISSETSVFPTVISVHICDYQVTCLEFHPFSGRILCLFADRSLVVMHRSKLPEEIEDISPDCD